MTGLPDADLLSLSMAMVTVPLLLLVLGAPQVAKSRGTAAVQQAPAPVYAVLPPISVPADLGALGIELSRAITERLVNQRLLIRGDGKAQKGDEVVNGRIEKLGGTRIRLFLEFAKERFDAAEDLEHLEDLVREAHAWLAGRLGPKEPAKPEDKPLGKPPGKSEPKPPKIDPRPSPPDMRESPRDPQPPQPPDPAPPDMRRPPPEERDLAAAVVPQERARIAVHVVGVPPNTMQAFYGVGHSAQQALMNYVARRLSATPVPVSLVGLVPGEQALRAAERGQANFSMMARFDVLSVSAEGSAYPPVGLTLHGKLYVVLLHNGYAVMERSVPLPQTAFSQNEEPALLVSRAVSRAIDGLTPDLLRVLNARKSGQ